MKKAEHFLHITNKYVFSTSPAIFPSIYIRIRINTWTRPQILRAKTLQSSYRFYVWISTQVWMKPDIFFWREEKRACLDRRMLWIRPLSLASWDSPNPVMIYCISLTSCILLNPLMSFSCKPQHEAHYCINTPNIFNTLGKSLKDFSLIQNFQRLWIIFQWWGQNDCFSHHTQKL